MLIGGKKNFAESLSLWRLRITKSGFERVIITHNYTVDIFGRKSLTIHNYTLGNNYTLPDYNFWFFLKDLYTSQKLHDKKIYDFSTLPILSVLPENKNVSPLFLKHKTRAKQRESTIPPPLFFLLLLTIMHNKSPPKTK